VTDERTEGKTDGHINILYCIVLYCIVLYCTELLSYVAVSFYS